MKHVNFVFLMFILTVFAVIQDYGRAKVSKEHGLLFSDAKAVELVEKLDYDFSTEKAVTDYLLFASTARAMQFDNK